MEGILFEEPVGHRLTAAEMDELHERRVASANSWPSWFDELFPNDEASWLVGEKKVVADVGGILQHATIVAPAKFSYEFRVRCKNQYGEWGPWSLPSRPVHLPDVPAERPVRPAVGGMRVYGTGGGYQASTEEIRRFIRENLEADSQLGDLFGAWVKEQLWGLMRTFWRHAMLSAKKSKRAIAAERAPPAAKTRARNVEADDVEKISPKLDMVAVKEYSKVRKGIAGAAVRLSRSVWVPIAESAAAGRPSLLAMLPKHSSSMATSFHHDKKLNQVKRSTAKGKKRSKKDRESESGGAGGLAPIKAKGGAGGHVDSRAASASLGVRLPGAAHAPGLLPPGKEIKPGSLRKVESATGSSRKL